MTLSKYRIVGIVVLVSVFGGLTSWAASKKGPTAKIVDSGVFGVYVNGKRVASEKFEVTQTADSSVAKAELKLDTAKDPQISELQLTPSGDLIRYQWSEKDKGTAVVEPKDDFLVEHVQLTQPGKAAEQPFLLPVSTMILDDYFFSHRQLLLWRYLAGNCKPKPGEPGCQLQKMQYGVIVPRQQTSAQVTVQFAGNQKVAVKGVDQLLTRFELSMDGNDWTIWMDGAYKIQKIAIEAEHAEVYRE